MPLYSLPQIQVYRELKDKQWPLCFKSWKCYPCSLAAWYCLKIWSDTFLILSRKRRTQSLSSRISNIFSSWLKNETTKILWNSIPPVCERETNLVWIDKNYILFQKSNKIKLFWVHNLDKNLNWMELETRINKLLLRSNNFELFYYKML
jgi:hypothetical protein